jgi:uncharacterized protein (DUF58 family)
MEGGPSWVDTSSPEAPTSTRVSRVIDIGAARGMSSVVLLLLFVLFVGVVRAQSALILLSSLLIVTAVVAAFWSRHSPEQLDYRRSFDPPRIFPGEETEYIVEITNRKLLPLPWVRVEEHMPAAVLPVQGGPRVVSPEGWQRRRSLSLGWHERVVLRQRFTCSTRGDYVVGPTDVETGDPLGLFPVQLRVPETHELLVYPRLAELPRSPLESRFPFGAARSRPPVLPDPIRVAGVRDYRPGDPIRFVDWKATARRMKLQTRVLEPTTLNNVVIVLDVRTMAFAWQGYDLQRFEAAVGVAGALLRDGVADRHAIGLAANASGPGMEEFQLYVRPSRRPSQLEDALGALATIAPIPTIAFGGFLERIAANFPYGASLVAVTAFLDARTASDLARLAERGHAISLVFLGSELPVRVDPRIVVRLLSEVRLEAADGTAEVVSLTEVKAGA